jgi:hypothetical protein
MILRVYTQIHVLISLVGILTGLIVLLGMLAGKRLDRWTKWFLITTVLTSVTGFFFPFHGFTPAIGLGIISLLVLAIAIYARYPRQLTGNWRWIYVVGAVISLYFNVRWCCAVVRKNTRAACDGPNPNRATIQAHAAYSSLALRCPRNCRSDQVPARTKSNRLTSA